VQAVSAGGYHSLALLSDHTMVAWGDDTYGQSTIPDPGIWINPLYAVAAGYHHNLGLTSSHSGFAFGDDTYGQSTIPEIFNNFVYAVAAGGYHNLALQRDGTVVAWGRNDYAQCDVPDDIQGRVVAVAAGDLHSMALLSDGSVRAWGSPANNRCSVPAGLNLKLFFKTPEVYVFINEIHYDNIGTDVGKAIEVAGTAGTDLTGWSLVLYNGTTGAVYTTLPLSGIIPNQQSGVGTISFPVPVLQLGSPDGMALVDPANAVIQFLSYEGSFTAIDGPAAWMDSVDIGVSESPPPPVGYSLQLTGIGNAYADFSWSPPAPATFGAVNRGQIFTALKLVEKKPKKALPWLMLLLE
jgi:hypothetical protein